MPTPTENLGTFDATPAGKALTDAECEALVADMLDKAIERERFTCEPGDGWDGPSGLEHVPGVVHVADVVTRDADHVLRLLLDALEDVCVEDVTIVADWYTSEGHGPDEVCNEGEVEWRVTGLGLRLDAWERTRGGMRLRLSLDDDAWEAEVAR